MQSAVHVHEYIHVSVVETLYTGLLFSIVLYIYYGMCTYKQNVHVSVAATLKVCGFSIALIMACVYMYMYGHGKYQRVCCGQK